MGVPEKILPGSLHLLLGWGQVGGAGRREVAQLPGMGKGSRTPPAFLQTVNQSLYSSPPLSSAPLPLPETLGAGHSRSSRGFCSANQVNSLLFPKCCLRMQLSGGLLSQLQPVCLPISCSLFHAVFPSPIRPVLVVLWLKNIP